ncbi:MAG: DUF4190 domain-containing protein [Chiayiivirga sp.]|jgi:hypothetical protein|uniref:DUF4190 domain-containing protein n=1 Tax=Chiayiivirga sp. TaxID=2041042 RepID=UPI0025C391FA|nr:DUF4190 domain-containing protein [Chiayiivirga sp.]MCI1709909.1 DUF4190 domain-containing protein [Chiayiivirga sp.]MCI1730333.1 DUF4190 domain-containing protein [Chiayiivirga sp.]
MNSLQRQTSTLAVVSLVFGVLGWVALPLVGSTVAIVTGHMARNEIRRAVDQFEGDGLAIAGLVLGYLWLGLAIAVVAVLITFLGGLAWLAGAGH